MLRWRAALFGLLVLGCAGAHEGRVDVERLKGAWSSDGQNFDFVIQDRSILFEFDMKEHPYRLEGDVVVVDFEDPSLGIQRKRVVRLSVDELEWEDVSSGVHGTYRRLQQ
jgi:hypothetical protein